MEKRLYRSRTDRMVSGVCGGLAEYFGIDPTIVRVAAVVLACVQGIGIIAYIVLAIVVPEEGEKAMYQAWTDDKPRDKEPDASGMPGNGAAATPTAPETPSTQPVSRPSRGGITGGIALIVIGGLFFASQFIPWIDVWRFWPLILVAIGVSMIVRSGRR